MISQEFLPCQALREYITCYQLRHFVFPAGTPLPYKPYAPRPEQTLVFHPRGHELVEFVSSKLIIKRPRAYVMGQYVERTNRQIGTEEFIVLLVNFQPGVLYRLTGIPYHRLTNIDIDAEAIFSGEVRRVNARLGATDDYNEMIRIVEHFLLQLTATIHRDAHALDSVANLVIKHPQNTRAIQLAKDAFLSSRQFERKFKERLGISPKLYSRIARVTKAFRMKYNNSNLDWLSIALECGYHDYQHLSKDFLDFAAVTPANYLLEDDQAPERFFGLRDSSIL